MIMDILSDLYLINSDIMIKYYDSIMTMIKYGFEIVFSNSSSDEYEEESKNYKFKLAEGILYCITSIFKDLEQRNKAIVFKDFVPEVLNFLGKLHSEETNSVSCYLFNFRFYVSNL